MYGIAVRADLADAQAEAWRAVGQPGPFWTGRQRVELAQTALDALRALAPLPPWVAPSTVDGALAHVAVAPPGAHDIVYRVARHAGTLTEQWYRAAIDVVGELAYVELVALTCHIAAVWSFHRSAGIALAPVAEVSDAPTTGNVAPALEHATFNWVPVAAPADQRAAVLQAFSALPDEYARTWRLAAAQYMADEEMVHPIWTRGTLSRSQMELLAMAVSRRRECFY